MASSISILTQDELDACRVAFAQFDLDGSSTIDQWELKQVLELMGQKPTEEDVVMMIAEVDCNQSNAVDYVEFLQVIAKQKEKSQMGVDSDVMEAWVAVGGDQPAEGEEPVGIVDTNKLIKIIKQDFGLPIDIEMLITAIDTDGSGSIDFQEFKALLS